MVDFKDGIKISDAYVTEDGIIVDAEYEGTTPLSAYLLNLMQRIDTASLTLPKNTVLTNNYLVTLPLQYQVGNNSLEILLSRTSVS